MKHLILLAALVAPSCRAADVSGEWVAQISRLGDLTYARVTLKAEGPKLSGTWNGSKLEGTVSGDHLEFSANGKFTGGWKGAELAGEGTMGGRGGEGPVTWKMTRPIAPPGAPKTWDYEPKEFYRVYSASIPPVLHVYPGDTIRTSTVDSGGIDKNKVRRIAGGNAETGPFYIEGALPGDTLVVKLNKVHPNRDTARSGSRINTRIVTPAYAVAADYAANFNSEWKLDFTKGIATLAAPTDRMKNYTVPIKPMIGCLGVAPPGEQAYRANDLGPFGGNMDYNRLGEGATLYLPVFHPGALFFLGDGHAAMGDGELTTAALETSLDVEFTVDLVKGFATPQPRAENADYLMSIGVAGSLQDCVQIATAQLANWLKGTYKLNDSEVAVVLGTALEYDITEMVDPQYTVSARIAKKALAGLK